MNLRGALRASFRDFARSRFPESQSLFPESQSHQMQTRKTVVRQCGSSIVEADLRIPLTDDRSHSVLQNIVVCDRL